MNYTDAHCHLLPGTGPVDGIVGRICNAVRESEWAGFVENCADETFACIGIHPWYIGTVQADWQNRMVQILQAHPQVMVGEVGLDKHHDNMQMQISVLCDQLEIAARFRRPLHLHCVGAWDKILHILKERGRELPPAILAHGFNDNPDLIEKLADKYNMFFSYCVTDVDNAPLVARIAATPRDRLLMESDADNPGVQIQKLQETLHQIADMWCVAPDEACQVIYTNFQRITSYVRTID